MSKRFDGSQQALDLNNIRTDPGKDTFPDMVLNELISLEQVIIILNVNFLVADLVSQNIEVILNRKTNMEAVIKIIEENIPEVILLLSEN